MNFIKRMYYICFTISIILVITLYLEGSSLLWLIIMITALIGQLIAVITYKEKK